MRAVLKRMINHVSESDELPVAELRFVIAGENEIFPTSDIVVIRNRLRAKFRIEIQFAVQKKVVVALLKIRNINIKK